MSNSQNKTNLISFFRQKVDDLLKTNLSTSELILQKSEVLKRLREAEAHQLELEKQNEELLLTQLSSRNTDQLYNLFPNGYFTLSRVGEIIEINAGAADFLNVERLKLIGNLFVSFIADETKPIFMKFLQLVFKNKTKEECEIILSIPGNKKIYAHLTGITKKCEDQCHVTIIDVSEKKYFEIRLQNERDLYQDLINNQPAGIYRIRVFPKDKWENNAWENSINPPYIMELASDRFCEILGITRQNFEANPAIISDLIHPQDITGFTLKNIESNAKLIPFRWDGRLLIHEKIVWVHLESIPRLIETGEILWTGILYDITSQKQNEEALKESEEKFRNIFEFSAVGKSLTTMDGKLHVNKAFCEIVGYTEEELNQLKWQAITFEDDIEFKENEIKEILKGAKRFSKFESRFIHKNGDIVWVEISAALQRDDTGNPLYFITTVNNINDKKIAERELKESEAKLSTLFSSMTEMVVMHELVFNEQDQAVDYRLMDCNDAFTEVTGIRKEDAIGKLATEVYRTETAPYLEHYARVAITGKPLDFDSYFAPFDKHFLISVVSPKENHFATITNDITDMQHIRESINEKNNELESYLYIASHDLRSPLINIQGFSQRLQKQSVELRQILSDYKPEFVNKTDIDRIVDENMPKTLNFILSNVSKMDTLINSLLQISRNGRLAMKVKQVDMNQLFNRIIAAYDFQIAELSAQVMIGDLHDCFGDENQLNQLFSNIIDNAIKYRDVGRQLQIEVSSKALYNKVIYTISDTGIGIKSRNIEKIWDVFYRVDSAASEAGEGIGLSITKRIANKHKGKTWVESEEGKGSRFYVELQRNEFLD